MNVLVEALTVSNFSGRHVFNGMLEQTVKQSREDYRFFVLYNSSNRDLIRDWGDRVQWIECAPWTNQWAKRFVWMRLFLNQYIKRFDCDWLYTPSGGIFSWVNIPQASYVANPWALAYPQRKNSAEHLKAKIQAYSYAQAVKNADLMIYISDYMRMLFAENAGCEARDSVLFYSGIKESTFASAKSIDKQKTVVEGRILTVSVMTPHKNLESIVEAMPKIKEQVPKAHWRIVGKWSDCDYELKIRSRIKSLGLEDAVEIVGYLNDEALEQEYAEAQAYCLMSKCESFGIPAVEAQAYGTPVVSSRCCAIPEVCGRGGIYCEPDDSDSVAQALIRLLSNSEAWKDFSQQALHNAERFHWDTCALPLVNKMNACPRSP